MLSTNKCYRQLIVSDANIPHIGVLVVDKLVDNI